MPIAVGSVEALHRSPARRNSNYRRGMQTLATIAKCLILTRTREGGSIDAAVELRGGIARTIGRTKETVFMFRKIWKSLFVLGTVASLAPVLSFAESNPCATAVGCQAAMPEGGSATGYLVAAGVICAGALVLGKRLRKTRAS